MNIMNTTNIIIVLTKLKYQNHENRFYCVEKIFVISMGGGGRANVVINTCSFRKSQNKGELFEDLFNCFLGIFVCPCEACRIRNLQTQKHSLPTPSPHPVRSMNFLVCLQKSQSYHRRIITLRFKESTRTKERRNE